jgi:AcrR family transcriptional regulator
MPRPAKSTDLKMVTRRTPRQARAREKVQLILEAALRLLERDGLDALNTNALAELAGVSIGTLYQYFPDKEAVLSALADREVAAMSAHILASLQQGPSLATPAERIRAVIRAVLDAYGGRQRAHRLLMLHSLGRGPSTRLAPLFSRINELLTGQGAATPGQALGTFSTAESFVLMHAIIAVLRATIAQAPKTPPRAEIEAALTRLILRFAGSSG